MVDLRKWVPHQAWMSWCLAVSSLLLVSMSWLEVKARVLEACDLQAAKAPGSDLLHHSITACISAKQVLAVHCYSAHPTTATHSLLTDLGMLLAEGPGIPCDLPPRHEGPG